MRKSKSKYIFLIIITWYLVSLYKIGDRDLWSAGETREAEIAQEMLRTGNFIIPKFNGIFLPWKPPLFHWAEAISAIFTNMRVDSFSSRLPSSLSFLIGALIMFIVLNRFISENKAFAASIIMLTSFKFLWMSRVAQIDALFSVLIGISYLLFLNAYIYHHMENKKFKALLLTFYFTSALSVLAKGPAGAILIGGGIFLFLISEKNLKFILKMLIPSGIVIFIIVSASWYIIVLASEGKKFAYEFFINQNINRFLKAFDHRHPIYYYIPQFFGGFFPWSIIAFFSIINFKFPRSREEEKTYKLFLWAFIFIFTFFSISSSKRGVYILPLYMPASVITALYLFNKENKKNTKVPLIITSIFLLAASIILSLIKSEKFREMIYPAISNNLSEFDKIMYHKVGIFINSIDNIFTIYISFALFASLLLLIFSFRSKIKAYIFTVTAFTIASVIFFLHAIIPYLDKERSLKPFSEKIKNNFSKEKIYSFGIGNEDLVYYLSKKVFPLENLKEIDKLINKNGSILLFTDTKYINAIKEKHKNSKILLKTGIKQLDGVLIRIRK